MALLTAEQVTNLYLYGTLTRPADLATAARIRPNQPTPVGVDINEYMAGPGRFASPVYFELLEAFFNPNSFPGLVPGVYTEDMLAPSIGAPLPWLDTCR